MSENSPLQELLKSSHGFMAEQPFKPANPNEVKEHHFLGNFLVVEPDTERAHHIFDRFLGAFGLQKAGVIHIDTFLVDSLAEYHNEENQTLEESIAENPSTIIQYDLATKTFAAIKLAEEKEEAT